MDVDGQVFGPYIGAMVEEFGLDDTQGLKESASMALEGAGAEEASCAVFVEALITKLEALKVEESAAAEIMATKVARQAEQALEESKVLRADREVPADEIAPETELERKARLELVKRYEMEAADSDDENASNSIVESRGIGGGGGGGGGERRANDNAERVKREEQEKRLRRKEESAVERAIAKQTGADGKKKKDEAKEKRRQKAVKGERKGGRN